MQTDTYFDSPERSEPEEIIDDFLLFKVNPLISEILEGFPEFVLVLNRNRQIVAFNNKAYSAFRVKEPEQILGKRIGEALNCIHSSLPPKGCGTAAVCSECGAAKAIKYSWENKEKVDEECKITSLVDNREYSHEFSVFTQPINFKDNHYTLFSVKDISSVKRKESLERIFFHDILNTSGAINGLVQLLTKETDSDEKEKLIKSLIISSEQLLNEILLQQEIRHAEEGNLQVNIKEASINEILLAAYDLYENHELSIGRNFSVSFLENDLAIKTDKVLVVRSLGNLIKNAFEATTNNDEIRLYPFVTDDTIYLNVYNSQLIPENVQLQLFQRSFSTKQKKGRGIGLYSVKLIIEQNLDGKVSFVSDKQLGTVFTIELPRR
jgi:sensor histidine kinase regulating citrate/malate metabolism